MDKYYILLEAAIALKELGYRGLCTKRFDIYGRWATSIWEVDFNESPVLISQPSYAQIFDWFEEVYGLK